MDVHTHTLLRNLPETLRLCLLASTVAAFFPAFPGIPGIPSCFSRTPVCFKDQTQGLDRSAVPGSVCSASSASDANAETLTQASGAGCSFNEVLEQRRPAVSGFPPCVFWLSVELIGEKLRSHVKSMRPREQTANELRERPTRRSVQRGRAAAQNKRALGGGYR